MGPMDFSLQAKGTTLLCVEAEHAVSNRTASGIELVGGGGGSGQAPEVQVMQVISVGEGHVSDKNESGLVPLHFKEGDLIVASSRSPWTLGGNFYFTVPAGAVLATLVPEEEPSSIVLPGVTPGLDGPPVH